MMQYQFTLDPPGSGIPSAGGIGQGCSGAFTALLSPTNISVPVISGAAQVNRVLTTTPGMWNNNPISYSYQWKSGVTNVGTNQNSYTPVVGDIGNMITVSVIATNAAGSSAAATSAATSVVTAATGGILDFSQALDSALFAAVAA